MWIEKRGRQHRVYYRTRNTTGPKKTFEPFASREQAEAFIKLAQASNLTGAIAYVRDPRPDALAALLGRPVTVSPEPSTPLSASPGILAPATPPVPSPADLAVAGTATTGAAGPGAMAHYSPLVDVTFDRLWEKFITEHRNLEETTGDLYQAYYENHFKPFFGGMDIGLIHRTPPLRTRDAVPGAVYVDDWLQQMMAKPKTDNMKRARPGTVLSMKFIKNVLNALAMAFDVALNERPAALLHVNPARDIKLPKTDRREMFFLDSGAAYAQLRESMHEHFRPLLDFLVGTGARFGEAAGLLVRNVHLDVARPYIDIRMVLKWARKRWKLGRPKTKSSLRRVSLSPKLVAVLRPLLAGKGEEQHVFTMVEGGPLHHGNFTNRYFRPAVRDAGTKVPKRLRIHDLRHTHAAWLLSWRVPVYVVQRRLGHSSSATTQDVYGHVTPDADDHTLEQVDRELPDLVDPDDEGTLLRITKRDGELPEFDVDDDDDLAA